MLRIAERVPLHVRALGLYMAYSLIMSTLTVNGLNLALPTIMEEFDVSVTTAAWVGIAYFVALSGGTLALGVFTTFFERRMLIVLGVAVDILLMVIIFYTDNIYVLIVCRFLSAFFRVFPWLILQVVGVGGFPPEKRGKAVGYTTMTMGIGLLVSLPVTGFFLDYWSWRWLFMVSAFIYVAYIAAVFMLLPKLPPETAKRRPFREFDFLGSVLMMMGMVGFITSLQLFARGFGAGPMVVAVGVVGVGSFIAFVWVELHAKSPILQFSLFKIPGVSLASMQAVVMGLTNGAFLLILPFLFINGYAWSAAYASFILLFQNITRPVAAPVAGRFADRFGSPAVIFPAAFITIAGQLAMAFVGVPPSVQLIMAAMLFFGTGQALMQTANLRQIYTALPKAQLHLAPAMNLVVSTLGTTSGQALGSLAVERGKAGGTAPDMVQVLGVTMVIITVFFMAGMVASQLLPRIFLRAQIAAGNAAAREAVAAGEQTKR